MSEDKLIAWLMVMQYQFAQDADSFHVPGDVKEEFERRKWVDFDPDEDWQGHTSVRLLPTGQVVRDINGPEWGLNTVPEESEA